MSDPAPTPQRTFTQQHPAEGYLIPFRRRFCRNESTQTPVAGRVYMAKCYTPNKLVLDMVNIRLNAAYPGNFRVGIYRSSGGSPDGQNIIVDSGDIAGGGAQNFIIPLAATIEAGWYWIAVEFDTATANAFRGSSTTADFPQFVASSKIMGCSYDQVYGALASPCPVTVLRTCVPEEVAIRSAYIMEG